MANGGDAEVERIEGPWNPSLLSAVKQLTYWLVSAPCSQEEILVRICERVVVC